MCSGLVIFSVLVLIRIPYSIGEFKFGDLYRIRLVIHVRYYLYIPRLVNALSRVKRL